MEISVSRALTSWIDRTRLQDVVWKVLRPPIISVSFRANNAMVSLPCANRHRTSSGNLQDRVLRPEGIRHTALGVLIVRPLAVDEQPELVRSRRQAELRLISPVAERLHRDPVPGPAIEIPGEHDALSFRSTNHDGNQAGIRRRRGTRLLHEMHRH